VFDKLIITSLLPKPGKTITLPDGTVVADPAVYDVDSTTVLAHSARAALFENTFRASFILPLEHFDYNGIGKCEPNSAVVNGVDLIQALDESLQGKVRIDFMKPFKRDASNDVKMLAQLTFTQPKSATYFKLMLGGRS
jgi:hypothetical protein